jgi:hypothetical protein
MYTRSATVTAWPQARWFFNNPAALRIPVAAERCEKFGIIIRYGAAVVGQTPSVNPNLNRLRVMSLDLDFSIFILHERSAAALRAKAMAERLAAKLALECHLCEFDLLGHPQACAEAAIAARAADMIVVAAHCTTELPAHVEDWFDSWLSEPKAHRTALVALLYGREDPSSPFTSLRSRLRQIADQGGMDFFCDMEECGANDLPKAETGTLGLRGTQPKNWLS